MPSGNAELVTRAVEHFRRGEIEAMGETLDPWVVLRPTEDWPEGAYLGHTAAVGFYERWSEAVGSEVVIEQIEELEDRVVARLHLHMRGHESGLEEDLLVSQVFTVRSGKIILIESFWDHEEARENIGLG